jgi:hypothetical protein
MGGEYATHVLKKNTCSCWNPPGTSSGENLTLFPPGEVNTLFLNGYNQPRVPGCIAVVGRIETSIIISSVIVIIKRKIEPHLRTAC